MQKGGKIGLFGGAGVGKDRPDSGADPTTLRQSTAAYSVFTGVGERTREGNDLYNEMKESGVTRQDRAGIRSDERAAGSQNESRSDRAYHGGVFP